MKDPIDHLIDTVQAYLQAREVQEDSQDAVLQRENLRDAIRALVWETVAEMDRDR